MTNNTMKKFLRMLGIVWSVALTVLVFAILLLKVDLVIQILSSTPVVAVVCIVFGISVGFIAGAIVCFLNTAKAVDAREAQIKKLRGELKTMSDNYKEACKTLTHIYTKRAQHEEAVNAKRGNHIMSEIMDFDSDFEVPDEEIATDVPDVPSQEEEAENIELPDESN